MERLDGHIQHYAWGSRTAIANLVGLPGPTQSPQAELWMGAHPLAPSRVLRDGRWQSLLELVRAHPMSELGLAVAAEFGGAFPFLFKVLAAEQPLSLQAHPNREQAQLGFAADEARGIPSDAPERRYRDSRHKPELLCALTPFHALCGFRSAARSRRLLLRLQAPGLAPVLRALEDPTEALGLRRALEFLLSLTPEESARVIASAVRGLQRIDTAREEFQREASWGLRLATLYPRDAGVLVALLLKLIELAPGEAVYLPAGMLHSYLGGLGVELMASSDNVLRGGLTPKHVDVAELLRVLDFHLAEARPACSRVLRTGEQVFDTPAREFRLSRLDLKLDAIFRARVRGPEILLCTDGALRGAGANGKHVELCRGSAAFVSAATLDYELQGTGSIFRAAAGGNLENE